MSASINGSASIASPLVLSDRLIALAIDADRGGYTAAAKHLVAIAHDVLDGPSHGQRTTYSRHHVGKTSNTRKRGKRIGLPGQ